MIDSDEFAYVCNVCNLGESDPKKLIKCTYCSRHTHFTCNGLYGKAVKTAKKKPFCCIECTDVSNGSSNTQHNQDDIMNELRELGKIIRECSQESSALRCVFQHIQQQMTALIDTNKRIERSQDFLGKQFDSIQADFNAMRDDIVGLKLKSDTTSNEVTAWQAKYWAMSSKIDNIEMELERMNRSAISKHAVILGIPLVETENAVA